MQRDTDLDNHPVLPNEIRIAYDDTNPHLKEIVDEVFMKLFKLRTSLTQSYSSGHTAHLKGRMPGPRD